MDIVRRVGSRVRRVYVERDVFRSSSTIERAEMAALPKGLQLDLLAEFQFFPRTRQSRQQPASV